MKMDKRKAAFRQAISCLPPIRRAQLERLEPGRRTSRNYAFAQDSRLRRKPPSSSPLREAVASAETARRCSSRAAQYSVHGLPPDSLRHGFLTLSGGHRLGIYGTAAEEDGRVLGVRGLSSINLRIAHQAEDLQAQIARWIGTDEPQSTLLLSPPGYGKTTLLREWVRYFSDRGFTAAIADRHWRDCRSLMDRCAWLAVGRCTDVMEGCSK